MLTNASAMRCTVCLEHPQPGGHFIATSDGGVCGDCITTMVQRVVDDLDPYPVQLDHRAINPDRLTDVLSNDLIKRYNEKKIEHETFPAQRVYCACGKFVNHFRKMQPGEEIITIAPCKKPDCGLWVCLLCASPLDSADLLDSIMNHDCHAKRDAKNEDMNKMLQSNERGQKFQVCPNCERLIQLSEACNHITCHCGTDFCYACGEKIAQTGRHWGPGSRCPRWPQRNPAAAQANAPGRAAQAAADAARRINEGLAAQRQQAFVPWQELAQRANQRPIQPPNPNPILGLPGHAAVGGEYIGHDGEVDLHRAQERYDLHHQQFPQGFRYPGDFTALEYEHIFEQSRRRAREWNELPDEGPGDDEMEEMEEMEENNDDNDEEEEEEDYDDDEEEYEHFDGPPHRRGLNFHAPPFEPLTGRGAGIAAGQRERTDAQDHETAQQWAARLGAPMPPVYRGQQMQPILPPARPEYPPLQEYPVPRSPMMRQAEFMHQIPLREEAAHPEYPAQYRFALQFPLNPPLPPPQREGDAPARETSPADGYRRRH